MCTVFLKSEETYIPQRHPAQRDSRAAKRFSVTSPSKPPKVMIGDREAKYKNVIDAIL
jgi:hypothetical protein